MTAALCDDHIGEDHPPRCSLCESLSIEYALLHIEPPRVDPDHARVVWSGIDCAWAACSRCGFDGPRRYGLLCHGQALIDLEEHTARHRTIPSHLNTPTTQRSSK